MSDKENKNEFVFEDENENHTQEYTESSYSGSTENLKTIFKNKRIITLAGGVVVIWVLSFILENVFGNSDKIVEKATSSEDIKQATNELTSTAAVANNDAEDIKSLASNDSSMAADPVAESASINNDLADSLAKHTATIQSLQDIVDVNKIQLNQLSNQMAYVADQVSSVTAANADVTDKVATIEANIKAKAEAAKKVVQPKLENYYIKALISGRAWLVGPDKEYITVIVGDKLKDYGNIVDINPDQGMITTSSGRAIRFASH
jgi:intracellular multiplication protein IcmG